MKSVRRWRGAGWAPALGVTLIVLAGCAPMVSAPVNPPTPPPSPASSAAEPASVPTPAPAPPEPAVSRVDTIPSPEAERVLATIPEPIPGRPRALTGPARPRPVPAPDAGYDTLRIERSPEEVAVPVPSPTPVLGSGSTVEVMAADSLGARPPASPPAEAEPPAPDRPTTGGGGAGVAAAGEGPCWRVQVSAPETREEADSRQAAAQSLLLVAMVVEPEKGLYKVRTRDCMSREAAQAMRQRALDSGFEGSFLVDTSAASKPPAPKSGRTPKRGTRRSGTGR